MKHQSKLILITALIMASTAFAHADLVIYDLNNTAANTLTTLGTDFIIGCAILAGGVVAAVYVSSMFQNRNEMYALNYININSIWRLALV